MKTVHIEEVEEFWDRRPCNIRHSPAEVGTRRYFDEVEQRKYLVEPHIPRFAEFERWAGQKVLEVGCGIGTDTINFARAGAHVTAVDLSDESVALTRRRAELYGLADKVKVVQADAERLSDYVSPEPYDLVYSFGVLHHTPDPERALRQIGKHFVRRGSVLKLMLYHRYSWKALTILIKHGKGALWKLDQLIAENSEAQTGCPVTFSYSRREVRRMLAEGFEINDIWVDHVFPYKVSDYVQYRYKKALHFQLMSPPLFRLLEHYFGWHLCVDAQAK